MAGVLTEESRISCATNGVVDTTGEAKLTVAGKPVLVLSGVSGKSLAEKCGTTTNTNTGLKECTAVTTVTAGQATKLTIGNAPVLLDTFAGTTDGIHPAPPAFATLTAQAVQTKLKAV